MKNEVVIFDIDGCILPDLFKNYGWAGDQDRQQVINEVNAQGQYIELFPAFVEYYKNHCKNARAIYFVTGRQEAEFRQLTLLQLYPLFQVRADFTIVWYPPNGVHTAKKYFQWKLDTIKQIVQQHAKEGVFVSIFDDLPDHFKKLSKLEKKGKVRIFPIKIDSNELWESIEHI